MGFPARYKGHCLKCSGVVEVGHYITWSRTKGQKGVYHVDCQNVMGDGIKGEGEASEKAMQAEYENKPVENKTYSTMGAKKVDMLSPLHIVEQPGELAMLTFQVMLLFVFIDISDYRGEVL